LNNAIGLNLELGRFFDGGAPPLSYRQQKAGRLRKAASVSPVGRDFDRQEGGKPAFYEMLKKQTVDIVHPHPERVIYPPAEALEAGPLRFRPVVTTQREVWTPAISPTPKSLRPLGHRLTTGRLAELRRTRTGLDQARPLASQPVLAVVKPQADPTTQIPDQPLPLASGLPGDSIL